MKAPKCRLCGAEHYGVDHVWPAETVEKPKKAAPGRPQRDATKQGEASVLPVNTSLTPVNTKGGDRHKPGYMAAYMRARRASQRAAA